MLALPAIAHAQTNARPTDKFEWSIVASSLSQAQGYTYELELDAVLQTAPLVHTCTGSGAGPFTCSAPIPAVTPTTHTARVRAADKAVVDQVLVSDWSDPVTFTMRAVPGKPGNLRILPAPGPPGTPGVDDAGVDGFMHVIGEVPAPGARQ